MKNYLLLLALVLGGTHMTAQIASLEKTGKATRLIVDGKPFIMLAGELHNSTSSDPEALKLVWPKMKAMNLNTVIASASWELVEPEEGKYNFDLVDAIIQGATCENLKVVLIWFGSWKSTASTYAPVWVKANPARFPRFTLQDGSTLEILSPFSESNRNADARAYTAMMKHIAEVDKSHTVIMTQVENEPGCFEGYRDFSSDALKAWSSPVPAEMINYMKKQKGSLFPALEKAWKDNGNKTSGTWEQVFGKSIQAEEYSNYTEELFMSFYYSKFIDYVAALGRKELNLPAFCNAWMYNKRGFYPHATCNPHVHDAYRAAGTALDFYSPNTYTTDYDALFKPFVSGGNTLFVPESGMAPAGVLYSIGAYSSLGFSPFGIDNDKLQLPESAKDLNLFTQSYSTLGNMMQLITSNYGTGNMDALYIFPKRAEQKIELGNYVITATSSTIGGFSLDFGKSIDKIGKVPVGPAGPAMPAAPAPAVSEGPGAPPPSGPVGAAIMIRTGADEFMVVGFGVKLHFETKPGFNVQHLGFASIDEGRFENDQFIATKRWNGDEQKASLPEDRITVLKIKLYHF